MQLVKKLFLIGCFFIPFYNDFPLLCNNFINLSLFRSPSEAIFLLAFFLFLILAILKPTTIKILKKEILFISILMIFVYFSFFVNLAYSGNIESANQLYGIEKMMFSSFLWMKLLLLLLFYMIILRTIDIGDLAFYVRSSFILLSIYVGLEIYFYVLAFKLNYSSNYVIMNNIESFFHIREPMNNGRARGFAFEPSYLVVVLYFILPFLLIYKERYHTKYDIYVFIVIALSTLSPTAIVAGIAFYILYKYNGVKLFISTIGLFGLSIIIIFLLYNNVLIIPFEHMNSSSERIGSWIAGIRTFLYNPFFGVGPGMQGYWIIYHYPDFFWFGKESMDWYDLGKNYFNAPTFSTPLSILVSFGIVPILFVFFYMYYTKTIKYILITPLARASIISMFIVSLGMNGYVFLGYWIILALILTQKLKLLYSEDKCKGL